MIRAMYKHITYFSHVMAFITSLHFDSLPATVSYTFGSRLDKAEIASVKELSMFGIPRKSCASSSYSNSNESVGSDEGALSGRMEISLHCLT